MPVFRIEGLHFEPHAVTVADFPEVLRRINSRGALLVQREARENAWQFRDTGALAGSIQARIEDLTAVIQVPSNQPTAAYAVVMEEGRRPGAHPPPPEALHGWMRRHGIDESFAFVVARNIGIRGIRGRHYMERAFQSLQQQLPTIISEVLRGMGYQ